MKAATALPRLLLALAVVGAAITVTVSRDRIDVGAIEQLTRDLGVWAPIGHVVLFAVGTVLFAPGAVFGLIGGALFGPLWGTVLNLAGATFGATAAFLLARYIAADWVRARTSVRIERLMAGVEVESWRFVALMRLVPLVPFNMLNYALGLTRISLSEYILASLIAMVPGTLAFTWLGYAGRRALGGDAAAIRYGLLALGVLATIAFLPRLVVRLRGGMLHRWIEVEELARLQGENRSIAIVDVRPAIDFTGPLGHIGGARNIPLAQVQPRLPEIADLRTKPVVLVCRTHKMSASAAAQLDAAGFRDVRVLRGGMIKWNEKGLPVSGRAIQ